MAPLPRRICLIGPESTGKSELGVRLARELGVPYVAEFAREYAEARGNDLSAADVEPIARGQMLHEDAAPDAAILDTDLISTVVYARFYYGSCPSWIEAEARKRRADLYLLMDTDIAWQADAARDTGGDAREDLFDAFRAALEEFETRWEIVSGTGEARWQAVLYSARERSDMDTPTEGFIRGFHGIRYQVTDVARSIDFYTQHLGFKLEHKQLPAFAALSLSAVQLLLSGPGASGSRALPNGEQQQPGGWNRIVLRVADLPSCIEALKTAGVRFRNEMEVGPGGKQIQLLDPDGNPVELFEPARRAE